MLLKKNDGSLKSIPIFVATFRILHGVLFCYAAAIIGIVFFLEGAKPVTLTLERLFALAVAIPMLIGSFFFFLAVTTRVFFGLAIFFCAFLTFALIMMPLMTSLFFPMHLVVFCLAAVYGASCAVLMHYLFALPLPKKKIASR